MPPETMPPLRPQTQKKGMPGWAKALIVLAILGVGGLVAAGIGLKFLGSYLVGKGGEKLVAKGLEKVIEKSLENAGGGKADVDLTKDRIVFRDKESGKEFSIRSGAELPEGFPKDVPVFSPAQVAGSMVMGPMTMVTFESASTPQEISGFYQTQLTAQGWQTAFQASPTPQTFSALFKKENRQVTVNVTSESEGKTSLVLSYGLEQMP